MKRLVLCAWAVFLLCGGEAAAQSPYVGPGEIEEGLPINILPASVFTFSSDLSLPPPGITFPTTIAPISYRTSSRYTTISAAAWRRQDFTARSSLVYLGGLGFFRYGVRPFVGLEGRIGLGEHTQLVPGFRFHAIDNAWLLRPSVGLNWMF